MKSERARAYLEEHRRPHTNVVSVSYRAAQEAVKIAEEEAEEALQALRDRFAADICDLVDRWDRSDKKIDRLWIKERDELTREIGLYKRALNEANERLKTADRAIAEKNGMERK